MIFFGSANSVVDEVRYMPLYAVTCRYMPLHAATCRFMWARAGTRGDGSVTCCYSTATRPCRVLEATSSHAVTRRDLPLLQVRAHLDMLAELNLPLLFLLLDFDRCSAIDSSAVAVLLQTRRLIKSARLVGRYMPLLPLHAVTAAACRYSRCMPHCRCMPSLQLHAVTCRYTPWLQVRATHLRVRGHRCARDAA